MTVGMYCAMCGLLEFVTLGVSALGVEGWQLGSPFRRPYLASSLGGE